MVLCRFCGGSPLTVPTFLKVSALLRLAERSGINGIPAYCDLRRVAADYSDLCGNVPPQIPTFSYVPDICRIVGRSGLDDDKDFIFTNSNVPPQIPTIL